MNSTVVLDRDEYERLYDGAGGALALGEASPHYLYVEKAPHRIKELVPDMKLVAVLRNPVDRAFSSYQHLVRDDLEPLDFGPALDIEPMRIALNYALLYRYVDVGLYTGQLHGTRPSSRASSSSSSSTTTSGPTPKRLVGRYSPSSESRRGSYPSSLESTTARACRDADCTTEC